MNKPKTSLISRVGRNLLILKKKANVSYEKIHLATSISISHLRDAFSGEANLTLKIVEELADFFGIVDSALALEEADFPNAETLRRNILAYLAKKGFDSTFNFKKLGPSYVVADFIENQSEFPEPLEANKIKDLINEARETDYSTNDVSRVLNKLAEEEGFLIIIPTDNKKKPKYDLVK